MLSITCYAYIDPASTSYIIQIGAGIVIALGTVIGICWNKITRLFKKKNNTDEVFGPKKTNDDNEKDIITADDLIIDLCIEKILDTLKESEYEVILRPHPQQVRHEPERFADLKDKYEYDSGNITIQTDFSSVNTVMEADVLITDWSDISWEYAFTTKRPVLFIDTPMKIMNPDYDKIDIVPRNIALRNVIGKSISSENADTVDIEIADLLMHIEEYHEIITDTFHKYIYNTGKSSLLCAKYIMKRLGAEKR